jgi:hypothetical protein
MLTPLLSQAELKSFLQFHRTGEEPLRDDEISILNGVLELNTKHVEEIMTPMAVSVWCILFFFLGDLWVGRSFSPASCAVFPAQSRSRSWLLLSSPYLYT